ncbi:unnamed protein product [Closterium sp. NIES-64]|nr:unnamed protein product [Closterium sp. NIES-64]
MIAGGVQLRNRVHKVTDFITETVDFTASVVFNLSRIVETSASINIANTVVPPLYHSFLIPFSSFLPSFSLLSHPFLAPFSLLTAAKKADIQSKARVANQTATELEAKTADGIVIINDALRVVAAVVLLHHHSPLFVSVEMSQKPFLLFPTPLPPSVSTLTFSIFTPLFVLPCMVNGDTNVALEQVQQSPTHHRVNGDTNVALEEVQQSPTMVSAMDKYLHCIPSDQIANTTRYARYTAATALTVANTSVTTNAPKLFDLLGVPGGLCVPYGPPPDYTRNASYCADSTTKTITFPSLVDVSSVCLLM